MYTEKLACLKVVNYKAQERGKRERRKKRFNKKNNKIVIRIFGGLIFVCVIIFQVLKIRELSGNRIKKKRERESPQ